MSKVSFLCQNCQRNFEVYPAFIRHAQKRGTEIKFCSRKCLGESRTKGVVAAKRKTGETLKCEVCSSNFYRTKSQIESGKSRFCSEPCRIKAFESNLIDRSQPRPQTRKGQIIECIFCGDSVYRKKSMIERNINKTCGKPSCVSSYGRILWGLKPREFVKNKGKRKRRATNFTSKQRSEWIDDKCVKCGTSDNLTLDHIIPVSAGGLSTKENSQTLCGTCNNWKAVHIDRFITKKQAPLGGF